MAEFVAIDTSPRSKPSHSTSAPKRPSSEFSTALDRTAEKSEPQKPNKPKTSASAGSEGLSKPTRSETHSRNIHRHEKKAPDIRHNDTSRSETSRDENGSDLKTDDAHLQCRESEALPNSSEPTEVDETSNSADDAEGVRKIVTHQEYIPQTVPVEARQDLTSPIPPTTPQSVVPLNSEPHADKNDHATVEGIKSTESKAALAIVAVNIEETVPDPHINTKPNFVTHEDITKIQAGSSFDNSENDVTEPNVAAPTEFLAKDRKVESEIETTHQSIQNFIPPTPSHNLLHSTHNPDVPVTIQTHQYSDASKPNVIPYHAIPIEIGLRALDGAKEISLELTPKELGQLNIVISVDHDAPIQVSFVAEKPQTLALLHQDASHIRHALEQAGYATSDTSLQFSLQSNLSSNSNAFREGEKRSLARQNRVPTEENIELETIAPLRRVLHLNQLDLSV